MRPVEATVGTTERRIFSGEGGQPIARQAQAHLARLFIERSACDQLRQNLIVDAERAGLFTGNRRAELLREHVHLPVVRETVLEDRHLGVANSHDAVANPAKDRTRDAPNGKAEHQKDKQKLGDPGPGRVPEECEHIFFR